MTPPLRVYGAALRSAAGGTGGRLHLVDDAGRPLARVDSTDWTDGMRPGDSTMLARCQDGTLDVGCGPGRLAAALTRTGRMALGVDISAEAVRQAHRRGAPAIRSDVFAPLPARAGGAPSCSPTATSASAVIRTGCCDAAPGCYTGVGRCWQRYGRRGTAPGPRECGCVMESR